MSRPARVAPGVVAPGDRAAPDRAATRATTIALLATGVVVTILAYPPLRIPGLGFVMLVPLVWLLEGRTPARAFALAWLYTTAMGMWVCRWAVHALTVEYRVAAVPAWLFFAIVIAGFALVQGAAGALWALLRPRGWAAPLVFASVWTLGEWLRGSLLGVPWILAAHSVARVPVLLQVADLGGAYLVSLVVLAANAGLALAARRRDPALLAGPLALLVATLGYGAWRLAAPADDAAPRVRVGIVQASVPQSERFQPGSALRNVARHEAATRALAAQGPLDLVVWSETAVDVDLDKSPPLRRSLETLATEIGTPIVTGAPRSERGVPTNAVVLVAPGRGVVESYDKQRLVPFSEYDPAGFGWLGRLIGPVVEGDPYVPGREATVFRDGPVPFSTPVCFEVTYPQLVGRFRNAGARLLVNLSNDAWFGPVGYPELHFDHAILRAVEMRAPVVRGANTGISGVVDARGRVLASQPAFTEGTLRADVSPAGDAPPYARTGDAPLVVALFIGIAAAAQRRDAAPGAPRRRSERSSPRAARDRAR